MSQHRAGYGGTFGQTYGANPKSNRNGGLGKGAAARVQREAKAKKNRKRGK
jgi:hypothetical protein